MHLSAGAHGRSRTVVHGAPRCQAAGMHLGARCTQASVYLLRDSLITHNTTSVPKRPDAPRCTVHLGARRPGCTSVQVHGDPNAPHQGAGAARAPCVTVCSWKRSTARHMLLQDSLLGALAVQVIWGLCWVASRTEPWPDTWTLVSIDTRTPSTRPTLVSIDTPPTLLRHTQTIQTGNLDS